MLQRARLETAATKRFFASIPSTLIDSSWRRGWFVIWSNKRSSDVAPSGRGHETIEPASDHYVNVGPDSEQTFPGLVERTGKTYDRV